MKRTIFYAWQSDSPNEVNRYFIREALDLAIARLNENLEATDAIRADQDTQGIPGAPTVADVIFSKIDGCTVFVADVTTIMGKDGGRPIPNPNVMIEYGRASKLGDSSLIQIFNEAYGDPINDRPFDLRHKRRPITYCLKKGESKERREKEKTRLSDSLIEALKLILENIPAKSIPLPSAAEFDHFRKLYAAVRRDRWQNRRMRIIGFWCAALPLEDTIDLGRVSTVPHVLAPRRPLRAKFSSQEATMNFETMDYSSGNNPKVKPIAGGLSSRTENNYTETSGDFVEAALSDEVVLKNGPVFIGVRVFEKNPHINIRCIMADVANVLRTVELVREQANAESQAYGLAVELRYDDQSDDALSPVASGEWRLCYPSDESGSVGPMVNSKPIFIGPKAIKSSKNFPTVLSEIFADLYEAAGRPALTDVEFEM